MYIYLHCRCSEKFYDPGKFQGRVALFPFDDDNAPPFELITPFCEDMDEWLNKDYKNVAIVHCLDGRVIRYSYTYIYKCNCNSQLYLYIYIYICRVVLV